MGVGPRQGGRVRAEPLSGVGPRQGWAHGAAVGPGAPVRGPARQRCGREAEPTSRVGPRGRCRRVRGATHEAEPTSEVGPARGAAVGPSPHQGQARIKAERASGPSHCQGWPPVRGNAVVTHSTTAFSGGWWYRPTTSTTFAMNCGSVESLKESWRWGLRSNFFQIRPMVDFDSRVLRHRGPRPVGVLARGGLQRRREHVLDLVQQDRGRSAGTRLITQPVQPQANEPRPPAVHWRPRRSPESACRRPVSAGRRPAGSRS